MKKYILCILLIVTTLLSSALPAYADSAEPTTVQSADGSTVTYLEDGSVLTVSPVYVTETNSLARVTKTASAKRVATYSDASGNLEWKYTLNASFAYDDGKYAACILAQYSHEIYGNGWKFSNGAATSTDNVARGTGQFKKTILFVTKTQNVDLTLTCDTYGNIT